MRKFGYILFAVVLIVSLVIMGCTSAPTASTSTAPTSKPVTTAPTSAGPTIKLKYSDQNPDTGWEGTKAAQPWLNDMTKATNGRVQFETYYSQTLFKGPDAWVSTKNGIADLAWMFHGYWANITTLSDVISLPLLPFTSAKQASGIFWQLYEKYPTLREQFKDNHPVLTFASQPYILITTKKQVKTLEDMKGLNIRVPGGPPSDMMKLLGAVPVAKGMPDTYLALQKGEIDGMAVPWEALISYRQYEVVKYYTYLPLFTVYFSQSFNNDSWNKLPKDVQDQLMSVCGLKGSQFWGENMFDSSAAAGPALVKQQGLEMITYTMPADELERWKNLAGKPLWTSWVAAQAAAGHPEAQDILNTTLSLIDTYKP